MARSDDNSRSPNDATAGDATSAVDRDYELAALFRYLRELIRECVPFGMNCRCHVILDLGRSIARLGSGAHRPNGQGRERSNEQGPDRHLWLSGSRRCVCIASFNSHVFSPAPLPHNACMAPTPGHHMVSTTFDLAGYRVVRTLGVVRGIVVRSRSIFGTIGAG